MPGIYWMESEFDPYYGSCGPNSLAMAECWAQQSYLGTFPGARSQTATSVMVRRMLAAGLCDSSGITTSAKLLTQARKDGFGNAIEVSSGDLIGTLKQELPKPAVAVLRINNGQALNNFQTGHGEDATNLHSHFILACLYHPGGFSFRARRDLPEGFFCADGDSDDANPYGSAGPRAQTSTASGNVLQFYTVPDLISAQPGELVVVYPKGVIGLANWTDDGTTLTAPNGHVVVQGFRQLVCALEWDPNDMPLGPEYKTTTGAEQLFTCSKLIYEESKGCRRDTLGMQWQQAAQQAADLTTQVVALTTQVTQLQANLHDIVLPAPSTPPPPHIRPTQLAATTTEPVPSGAQPGDTETEQDAGPSLPLVSDELASLGAQDVVSIDDVKGTKLTLAYRDMPETYGSADRKAGRAQWLFRWSVGAEQVLLVIAAAAGVVPLVFGPLLGAIVGPLIAPVVGPLNVADVVVAAALAGTVAIRLFRSANHPDSDWYNARILAEEILSQTWRYVMRVAPFDDASAAADGAGLSSYVELRFVERLERLRENSKVTLPALEGNKSSRQITPRMKQVREADLAQRVRVYMRDRLQDQINFYRKKAALFERRARQWNAFILLIEVAAFLAATASNFGLSQINVYGVAGTIVAGAGVWLQMKQFSTLARRYSTMQRNLEGYLDWLTYTPSISSGVWAATVDRIEELMEHEHEGWLHLYNSLHLNPQDQQTTLADLQAQGSRIEAAMARTAR